eukprot:GHVL01011973.1.p1 GENE.GHVL01011973.1~~GHVL01011973.1.p1  ORF type:complete len:452 (-),score=123.69 GHVL01011973.1:434-1759(-)
MSKKKDESDESSSDSDGPELVRELLGDYKHVEIKEEPRSEVVPAKDESEKEDEYHESSSSDESDYERRRKISKKFLKKKDRRMSQPQLITIENFESLRLDAKAISRALELPKAESLLKGLYIKILLTDDPEETAESIAASIVGIEKCVTPYIGPGGVNIRHIILATNDSVNSQKISVNQINNEAFDVSDFNNWKEKVKSVAADPEEILRSQLTSDRVLEVAKLRNLTFDAEQVAEILKHREADGGASQRLLRKSKLQEEVETLTHMLQVTTDETESRRLQERIAETLEEVQTLGNQTQVATPKDTSMVHLINKRNLARQRNLERIASSKELSNAFSKKNGPEIVENIEANQEKIKVASVDDLPNHEKLLKNWIISRRSLADTGLFPDYYAVCLDGVKYRKMVPQIENNIEDVMRSFNIPVKKGAATYTLTEWRVQVESQQG